VKGVDPHEKGKAGPPVGVGRGAKHKPIKIYPLRIF